MSPRSRLRLLVPVSLLLGVVLMIPFEATITRAFGVMFLVLFIVAGAFAVAEPGFLSDDEE